MNYEFTKETDPAIDSINISMDLFQDGKYLLVGNASGNTLIFDTIEKKLICSTKAHDGKVFNVVSCKSARMVATTSNDKLVKVWNFIKQ